MKPDGSFKKFHRKPIACNCVTSNRTIHINGKHAPDIASVHSSARHISGRLASALDDLMEENLPVRQAGKASIGRKIYMASIKHVSRKRAKFSSLVPVSSEESGPEDESKEDRKKRWNKIK